MSEAVDVLGEALADITDGGDIIIDEHRFGLEHAGQEPTVVLPKKKPKGKKLRPKSAPASRAKPKMAVRKLLVAQNQAVTADLETGGGVPGIPKMPINGKQLKKMARPQTAGAHGRRGSGSSGGTGPRRPKSATQARAPSGLDKLPPRGRDGRTLFDVEMVNDLFKRADKCEQGILRLKRIQFERRRKDPAIREWDHRTVEVNQLDRDVLRTRKEADDAEKTMLELEKRLITLRLHGAKMDAKRRGQDDILGVSEDTTALLGLILREQMADPLAQQWVNMIKIAMEGLMHGSNISSRLQETLQGLHKELGMVQKSMGEGNKPIIEGLPVLSQHMIEYFAKVKGEEEAALLAAKLEAVRSDIFFMKEAKPI